MRVIRLADLIGSPSSELREEGEPIALEAAHEDFLPERYAPRCVRGPRMPNATELSSIVQNGMHSWGRPITMVHVIGRDGMRPLKRRMQ